VRISGPTLGARPGRRLTSRRCSTGPRCAGLQDTPRPNPAGRPGGTTVKRDDDPNLGASDRDYQVAARGDRKTATGVVTSSSPVALLRAAPLCPALIASAGLLSGLVETMAQHVLGVRRGPSDNAGQPRDQPVGRVAARSTRSPRGWRRAPSRPGSRRFAAPR